MSSEPAKPYCIEGRTGAWEIVLGLEVHAQVASNAKLFSGAATGFGAGPNEQVSLVDAAFPGMLPVINRYCVEQAVKTGLGLKAKINEWSRFDRKNYFYPDLPQGYQISQFKDPVVGEGTLEVERDDGSTFQGRDRAAAPGAGRRQVDPRHGPELDLRRSEPLRRRADGDRLQAAHALAGGCGGLCEDVADASAVSGHLRRRYGEGEPARRRERLGLPSGAVREVRDGWRLQASRHPLRDQERQLHALHPAGHRL